MTKYEIALVLREIGTILELIDDNPKKGIAYKRAARVVESIDNLKTHVENHSLEQFPGIGKTISGMITTLFEKGTLPYYTHLKHQVPSSLFELTLLPGLGAKKARILFEQLHITSLAELEQSLAEEKIRLKGFGPAFLKKLRHQIDQYKQDYALLYKQALGIAEALMEALKSNVDHIEPTGALRRKLELISEIDLLAMSASTDCLEKLASHFFVSEILTRTHEKIRVKLKQGIIASLTIVSKAQFPLVLFNSTGNPSHCQEVQKIALHKGYEINDNEIISNHQLKPIANEDELYELLKIPYIVPELREGYGEIQAAIEGRFANLIEEKDLKGTFHCHTVASDGRNTIEELAQAAQELGWEYIGISDHSKSSYQANGLSEERLFEQIQAIKKWNEEGSGCHVFSGIECDILKDGELDFSSEVLKQLDFVIVSAHSFFNMEEEEMTKRFIKAIENPYSTIVGHLTGRILRFRPSYRINIPKVIDACIANGKVMELNAYPNRLDMDWRWWIKGKEKGLKCCINPDAHSLSDLHNCHYGINMARKGWQETNDVINTMSLKDMRNFLRNSSTRGYYAPDAAGVFGAP